MDKQIKIHKYNLMILVILKYQNGVKQKLHNKYKTYFIKQHTDR